MIEDNIIDFLGKLIKQRKEDIKINNRNMKAISNEIGILNKRLIELEKKWKKNI